MSELPRVMVAAPVRNRAHILPEYLKAISELDYPKDRIELYFLVNDCVDRTEAILREFAKTSESPCTIFKWDLGTPVDVRTHTIRQKVYVSLAKLRNKILDHFAASECEYLFSVDSDILVAPEILKRLVVLKKDMVGSHISNMYGKKCPNAMVRVAHPKNPGETHWMRFDPPKPDGLYEVHLTGAVCLMSRNIIGCRFAYSGIGEDAPFCDAVRAAGLRIWFDSKQLCTHEMGTPVEALAKPAAPNAGRSFKGFIGR